MCCLYLWDIRISRCLNLNQRGVKECKQLPVDIPLAKTVKEIKILNHCRFIRKDNTKEFSPVLVTSLGTCLPSETKLWFSVQRICQFIRSLLSMHEILQIQTLSLIANQARSAPHALFSNMRPCSTPVSYSNCAIDHRSDYN